MRKGENVGEKTIAGDIRRIRSLMKLGPDIGSCVIRREDYGELLKLFDAIETKAKRIHDALKPVKEAYIPDYSICDTCRDRSECEEYENSVTCEWYDIVEAVREAKKIYNEGGAK